MRSWWMLLALPLALGCGKKNKAAQSAQDVGTERDTRITLEKCDVASGAAESIDANGDGRADIVKVKRGGREVCRTADLNFDGKVDRTTFFDGGQKIRRVESDFDRDGHVDELAFFEAGVLKEKHRATTMDGKLDTWEFYEKGRLSRTERDEDGDGVIDQWWEYPSRGCPLIHVDTDGDGRPDPGASIDYCKETGYTPPPLPGEEEAAEPADFGRSGSVVEETENRTAEDGEVGDAEENSGEGETEGADAPAGEIDPGTGGEQ